MHASCMFFFNNLEYGPRCYSNIIHTYYSRTLFLAIFQRVWPSYILSQVWNVPAAQNTWNVRHRVGLPAVTPTLTPAATPAAVARDVTAPSPPYYTGVPASPSLSAAPTVPTDLAGNTPGHGSVALRRGPWSAATASCTRSTSSENIISPALPPDHDRKLLLSYLRRLYYYYYSCSHLCELWWWGCASLLYRPILIFILMDKHLSSNTVASKF